MKQNWNFSVSRVAANKWLLSGGGKETPKLLDFEAGTVTDVKGFESNLSLVGAVMLLVKDDIWVYFGYDQQPGVYKNGSLVGKLSNKLKSVDCRIGRADTGSSFLFVDNNGNLVEHKWADIMAGNFNTCTIVSTGVSDFALHGSKPVILKTDKILVLHTGSLVNLAIIDGQLSWSALEVAGDRVLVAGDLNNKAKIIVLNKMGIVRSQTEWDLCNNGHSQGSL